LALAGALAGPVLAAAQPAPADPALAEGIRLVEQGDYDAAILTLDNTARRLAADPARAKDLSQAYLYLGIAYMGKGHEAAARAKFREAVLRVKDLTLNPEDFPPKVIDAFEAARAEAMKAPAATETSAGPAPTSAAAPAPAPVAKKGGKSKTLWIVGGVGAAAAVGVAVAAGGGGGGGETNATPEPASPQVTVDDLSGFLPATEGSRHFPVRVRAAGTLLAELSWTAPPPVELVMQLFDAARRDVALSNRTAPNAAVLRADVVPQEYDLSVFYTTQCPGCETQYRLLVTHP
jgi:tetratricopeptide (TPR) repeat protein